MTHSTRFEPVDLLLIIAKHEWDDTKEEGDDKEEGLGQQDSYIYSILAEDTPELFNLSDLGGDACARFTLKHAHLRTVAARVPLGPTDTALITRLMLELFRPSIVAQVGFGGILSNDLRLGDVAVASQVDCYLTKSKAASTTNNDGDRTNGRIDFAGEVFRPSLSLVQLALNLKHTHPSAYVAFQQDVQESHARFRILQDPSSELQECLRFPSTHEKEVTASQVHVVHFACAELVSTTREAVNWLRSRDRKVAIIDMESGGLLAAVSEYQHRHQQTPETLIIRGGGGYGDEKHEGLIKQHATEIRRLAFQNACRFLGRMLSVRYASGETRKSPPTVVDVGILIPLEEEFSYFMDFLRSPPFDIPVHAEYQQGRYYYLFKVGKLTCAATFVGDMGLMRMALATADLEAAINPRLLCIVGIAAGFSGDDGDARICDVVIAKSIDLYMHRARNRMGQKDTHRLANTELLNDPPIETTQALVDFATTGEHFANDRAKWTEACAAEMMERFKLLQKKGPASPEQFGISATPQLLSVRLASGDLLAAATEFVSTLKSRGCSAADMEAGGAASAYKRLSARTAPPPPMFMALRGISDRGDEQKGEVQALGQPGMFRQGCMRNATRLLLLLLGNDHFADLIAQESRPGTKP
jgi:nucleoside phosphorylase